MDQGRIMFEMTVKLQFFLIIVKSEKVSIANSYVNLFMMSSNQKEQNLARKIMRDFYLTKIVKHSKPIDYTILLDD
jgi:hypothetical protein